MPKGLLIQKGSNCPLNQGAQLNSYSGCIQTELLLLTCKWHVSNTLYRMYTRMAIKSVKWHLPKILLMSKGSNCPLVHEYKPNLQVGYIQNRITVMNKCQMTC